VYYRVDSGGKVSIFGGIIIIIIIMFYVHSIQKGGHGSQDTEYVKILFNSVTTHNIL
jgi:hypothetical protein